jgi:cation transport regulator ChaB
VQGYQAMFPSEVIPYEVMTRLLEKNGELATEIFKWENEDKRKRRGEPKKEDMAKKVQQSLASLMQIVVYYKIENELEDDINNVLKDLENLGYFD